jgi:hypothetical protein
MGHGELSAMWRLRVWVSLVFATLLPAQQQSVIRGDYIEDRSNHVYGCYCEWSGESETGGNEAILAWNIKSGEFRGTDLAGVKVAVVIMGERTLSMGATQRKSVLLVDGAARKQQQRAVEDLVRENYAQLIGTVLGVYSVELDFTRKADKASLLAKGLIDLEMRKARLPEDALQGARLWYDPFIPMTESTLGTTVHTTYSGSDFKQQWNKSEATISGYFGTFALSPH